MRDLRKATWEEQTIAFDYTDYKGDATHRQVDPLGMFYMDRSTVLVAFCHLRQAVRVFRLDRMARLELTGRSFRPTRVPRLRDAMEKIRKDEERRAEDRKTGNSRL